jgi:hypothetical protein
VNASPEFWIGFGWRLAIAAREVICLSGCEGDWCPFLKRREYEQQITVGSGTAYTELSWRKTSKWCIENSRREISAFLCSGRNTAYSEVSLASENVRFS